jgi:tetratricopeptide (TPR) repeat protein
MYQEKHGEARKELAHAFDIARNDGERRAALFAMAVTHMDEGKAELALKEIEKQYALAEKIQDAAAMAADRTAMGNILLQSGKTDEAMNMFKKSLALISSSSLAKDIKANAELISHYNLSRVAISRGDLATAKSEAKKLHLGAEAKANQNQIRLFQELAGAIELHEKDYDAAIDGLKQANQQDPTVLFRIALAYQGLGKPADARKYCEQAAKFNSLPVLNYAYIRKKATKLLAAL